MDDTNDTIDNSKYKTNNKSYINNLNNSDSSNNSNNSSDSENTECKIDDNKNNGSPYETDDEINN